jgi:signal transduction histidine kinase
MRQLLQNLIGNAIKFRRPGVAPHVVVRAHPATHAQADAEIVWELRVADNGIGLEPANAERIFKPFERLHAHATFEGSGLGLAVCARIVERHGGRIRAEGQPGTGTTFVVTLPAAHRRREAA